ncbi:zf-HC2 domain-containing protein [Mariniblastus sp.]|nr:zf-HC2 domain-containing protein [Mariniblastus sp.]
MNEMVTPQMISAFVDGELSPEDTALVEAALAVDEASRGLLESYEKIREDLAFSSTFIAENVSMPSEFTSRVMADIGGTKPTSPAVSQTQYQHQHNQHQHNQHQHNQHQHRPDEHRPDEQLVSQPAPLVDKQLNESPSTLFSVRTVIEFIVATAAAILILFNWNGNTGELKNGLAANPGQTNITAESKKSDVSMLRIGDNGKSSTNNNSEPANQPTAQASREFAVIISETARPQVDRFWTMNEYEIEAPEQLTDSQVSVFLIQSKRQDAVKFFQELKKWDPDFKAFQDSGENASWLSPFDVSRADQLEGDVWTLRIVTIDR